MLQILLIAWSLVAFLMLALWLIQIKTKNAAIVDVGWAFGLVVMNAVYLVSMDGFWQRKLIVTTMVSVWGFRLAFFLLFGRVIGKSEDARYQTLREHWGKNANLQFLWFFQLQGLLNIIFSLPFFFAHANSSEAIRPVEWLGAWLWLVAFLGETLSDYQLGAFKKNSNNQGKVCNVGLWRYSRHPNYFFEFLIWCSYFLFATGSPYGWLSMVCPALIFYFLFKVTGIPATETQALKSKGDAYRAYQRNTSVFVPWFPKKG